jgi:hypothetical protein
MKKLALEGEEATVIGEPITALVTVSITDTVLSFAFVI